MDEVVNGFGRTGKMFGHMHYDVDPDIFTVAKGLASAYMPLSATVTKNEIFNVFLNDPADKMAYFRDISTYGGCAGASAAALETLRIVEEEHLVENSRVVGEYLLDRLEELREFPIVGDVRGRGLFAGIEFVEDRKTKQPIQESFLMSIITEIAKNGVLVGRTNRSIPGLNNIINLAPALMATKAEIDVIISAIRNALSKVSL
jgi:taurine-pyruvate aminotransferase